MFLQQRSLAAACLWIWGVFSSGLTYGGASISQWQFYLMCGLTPGPFPSCQVWTNLSVSSSERAWQPHSRLCPALTHSPVLQRPLQRLFASTFQCLLQMQCLKIIQKKPHPCLAGSRTFHSLLLGTDLPQRASTSLAIPSILWKQYLKRNFRVPFLKQCWLLLLFFSNTK